MSEIPNPYLGPRSFDEADRERFFGREKEIRQLFSLAVARRVVLLYAPSGAGKTSLLQAGLLPRLRALRDVTVLPIARVGGEPPPGSEPADGTNRFTLSALQYLLGGALPGALSEDPRDVTFGAGLTRLLAGEPEADRTRPHFLVLDQFEELFTSHPERYADRGDFLHELRDALAEHPQVMLLLAMREDYIAQLDAWRGLLPDHLRNRFRLELLGVDAAREAATGPAEAGGVRFRAATAARLVDELRRIRVQEADGTAVESLGPEIEPVQLQVVCRRLWDCWTQQEANGIDRIGEIGEEILDSMGSIDQALSGYYQKQVAQAAEISGVPERRVRGWVDRELITAQGLRGQVLREPEQTHGLDNRAIQALVAGHLVRAEERRGAVWFELAHDRLIEPVRGDNSAWREANLSTLERQAALWHRQGRPEGLVLSGAALAEAEHQAAATRLESVEQDFLTACRRQRKQGRTRLLAMVTSFLLVLALVLTAFSVGEERAAHNRAVTQSMAAESMALLDQSQDTSLRLAVEVGRRGDEIRSQQLLFAGLEARPHLRALLHGHHGEVLTALWSPDGRTLASGGTDGLVRLWDREGRPVGLPLTAHTGNVWSLAWKPNGQTLATAGQDGSIVLWDLSTATPRSRRLVEGAGEVYALRFTPDGRSLLAALEEQIIQEWDAATGKAAAPPRTGPRQWVKSLAVSPDGRWIAAGSMDHDVWLWDTAGGPPRRLSGHSEGISSLAFSPDSRTLASASLDGTIRLWDPETAEERSRPLDSALGAVESVAWSPDGARLAAGQSDGTLVLWDPATGRPKPSWTGQRAALHAVAWSPDGHTIASGNGATVVLWDADHTTRLGRSQTLPLYDVTAAALRPDGRAVAVAGTDSASQSLAIRLLDPLSGRPLGPPFTGPAERIRALAWSADGSALLATGREGPLACWEAATGRPLPFPASSMTGLPHDPALSPDGRKRATADPEGTLRLVDATAAPPRHGATVAWSPDGHTLATASRDRRLFLWDAATGTRLAGPFTGHPDTVAALLFVNSGRTLLSLGVDGTAFHWDVDPASWRKQACGLAGIH